MPSGQTHDRITLWSLPVVTGVTLALTRRSDLTLLVSGGFLFSGLMFSPDLDLYSRAFKRWGWLRWIWLPYQKAMRHRSVFSHGLLIGTTLRVLYLTLWIVALGGLGLVIFQLFQDIPWSWQELYQAIARSLFHYRAEGLALFVGLELGAISHVASDWVSSTYKRLQRKKKNPRRKSTSRKRSSG
ncbi:MAG TPA: metal-binding protein [Cyanobacteria bacterium UBA9273]|nr:metal-binding protein [Cyanobacteria bacterium UBA9273]